MTVGAVKRAMRGATPRQAGRGTRRSGVSGMRLSHSGGGALGDDTVARPSTRTSRGTRPTMDKVIERGRSIANEYGKGAEYDRVVNKVKAKVDAVKSGQARIQPMPNTPAVNPRVIKSTVGDKASAVKAAAAKVSSAVRSASPVRSIPAVTGGGYLESLAASGQHSTIQAGYDFNQAQAARNAESSAMVARANADMSAPKGVSGKTESPSPKKNPVALATGPVRVGATSKLGSKLSMTSLTPIKQKKLPANNNVSKTKVLSEDLVGSGYKPLHTKKILVKKK